MKKNVIITGGLISLLLLTGVILLFLVPPKQYKIALIPLGKVDPIYVENAKDILESFYKVEVVKLDSLPLPASSYYAPRNRYRADSILSFLKGHKAEYDKVIGITESDISATHEEYADWGIMGLAYQPGVSAVISTFRIKTGASSLTHVLERFHKVVLHETGHTFGIPHCEKSYDCLMHSAQGKVSTLDAEKKELCMNCKKKISSVLKNY